MAIVAQTKESKIVNLYAYVQDEISNAINDVHDEAKNDPRFKATYITGRDASAKTHLTNAIKALGWLKIDQGITANIAPYTDAQIDDLNREIREFDDGT